jgi:hypothetical protein
MLQGLDPATQGLVQALSAQRQQPKEVTVRTAQMPASIEANNLQRHQDYTDDVRNDLTGLSPGMGNFAPLAGVLKAYARARYDKGADATQEQLSEKVRASLEAEQAQAAAAAQAERERKKADELAKREYELEQWQREQAAARQAQQAGFAHDRNMQGMKQQATGPTQQEQVAQIMQMPDGPEKRQAMLLVAPELVKDQDAQVAANAAALDSEEKAKAAINTVQSGLESIDWLLNSKGELGPTTFNPIGAVRDAVLGTRTPLEQATGFESMFPTAPGSPAADAESRISQLEGQVFMKAIDDLKGSGTITDIEGAKGQAAISRLSLAQSDEEMKEALEELRGVLNLGVESYNRKYQQPSAQQPDAQQGAVVDFNSLPEGR